MSVAHRHALVCLAVLGLAACAHGGSATIEGRIASGGGYLGSWDFYPTVCEAQGDSTVVLAEEGDDKRRLLLIDRSGGKGTRRQKVDVHVDGDTPNGAMDILLTDARCVTSSLHRGEGGSFNGSVEVDCETGEGGRVRGTVKFANCVQKSTVTARR
jgi:hypothetical protein